MSSAPRYLPHYTVDDYQQWEGDWELWDGIAVAMTPSPFGRHQQVAANLLSQLLVQKNRQQCAANVLHEIDWIVSNDTVVRPDVLVLCGALPAEHVERTPAVIAEVLSPSTARRDRTEKFELYQDYGVGYYLILDPVDNQIEIWKLGPDGKFVRCPESDPLLTICGDCPLQIRSAELF